MPIRPLTKDAKLRPGRFYRAGNRSVWCCFCVYLDHREHRQAHCVNVGNGNVEYFFLDGRYEVTGKDSSRLVEELVEEQELGMVPSETDLITMCVKFLHLLVDRQSNGGSAIETMTITSARELRNALTRKLGEG